MITLRVNADFSAITKKLKALPAQAKAAGASALNKCAWQSQSEIRIAMTRVFDRPTEYALNATMVKRATPNDLYAKVYLKNKQGDPMQSASNFLYPEVFGQGRGQKAMEGRLRRVGWLRSNEFLVPAKGLPLDPFGNVPTGMVRSILSQAGAAGGEGYSSNKTSSAASKRTVRKRGAFFMPEPGSKLPRGIYQRVDFRTGTRAEKYTNAKGKQRTRKVATYGANAIRMVMLVVTGKPSYRARLHMHDIVNRVVARDFRSNFERELGKLVSA